MRITRPARGRPIRRQRRRTAPRMCGSSSCPRRDSNLLRVDAIVAKLPIPPPAGSPDHPRATRTSPRRSGHRLPEARLHLGCVHPRPTDGNRRSKRPPGGQATGCARRPGPGAAPGNNQHQGPRCTLRTRCNHRRATRRLPCRKHRLTICIAAANDEVCPIPGTRCVGHHYPPTRLHTTRRGAEEEDRSADASNQHR